MNKDNILEYLENNGLTDVDIIREEEGLIVATAFYDFDDEEMEAAKAYAEGQITDEEDEEASEEYLMNYLVDLAVDNLGEVFEELIDEEGIDAQYLTYEMDPEEPDTIQVAMLFSKGDLDKDLEDILDELEM
ncbi:hypothetical protein [Proteiniclasticum ruminis]|uniref:Uncharacterized protein n=1 Tax=Proteiniclasticum ruminis TaxID=398199 RepID=A0A1I4ZUV3_9CLOT|nr:hypothetical protein [Proteiniclasticum ruminis]SFN53790.1 hypothetical protein SAMN04488695_102156 [Proteiniclasticum ruminis]